MPRRRYKRILTSSDWKQLFGDVDRAWMIAAEWRLTLEVLSEKDDCSFFALCMRSLSVGMGTTARTLTAVERSSVSRELIAPGVGLASTDSKSRTCKLGSLSISIALSYVSDASV